MKGNFKLAIIFLLIMALAIPSYASLSMNIRSAPLESFETTQELTTISSYENPALSSPLEPEPLGTTDYMIYGGTGLDGHLFSYDPKTQTFSDKASFIAFPWQLIEDLTTGKDGKIYGITYYDTIFFIYDPITDKIIRNESIWTDGARGGALTTGPDGKIYGGTSGTLSGAVRFFIYDPITDIIIRKENFILKSPTVFDLTTGLNNKIYGGSGGGTTIPNDAHLFSYDIMTDSFSGEYNFGSDRSVIALTTSNDGKIYGTVGGFVKGYNFFIYDPVTDITSVKNFPGKWIPMYNSLTVGNDGKIYGGVTNLTGGPGLYIYDPLTDTFTEKPTGDSQVPYDLVTNPDGKIYIGTSYRGTGAPAYLYVYDPVTDKFENKGEAVSGELEIRSLTISYEQELEIISPSNLRIEAIGNDVILTWDPSLNAVNYSVYRSQIPAGFDFFNPYAYTFTTTFTDYGVNNPSDTNYNQEYYYVVRAVDNTGKMSTTTYTAGKFTKIFREGSDIFSLPLEPYELNTIDWYCDQIPGTTGISYLVDGVWKFHSCEMPKDVYDELVYYHTLNAYQISTEFPTQYTFVGTSATHIKYIENLNSTFRNSPRLKAVPNLLTTTDINLTWDSLPGATGYKVFESSTRTGFDLDNPFVVEITDISVLTYVVPFPFEHYYMIVAYNSTGHKIDSTYSIGFQPKFWWYYNYTFGLPFHTETHTLSWHCSNIINCYDILYINDNGHWQSFKTKDINAELGSGYWTFFDKDGAHRYIFLSDIV